MAAKVTNGGKILVFGATGMLGQALLAEAGRLGVAATGSSRSDARYACDLNDPDAIFTLIDRLRPRAIINAAALVDLAACEADPGLAYRINGRAVAFLVEACRRHDCRLVQISTDHFFTGDGDSLHDENAPVHLLNEYARSKYAGEAFALTLPGSLVLRTNITGFRGWPGKATFAEWLFEVVEQNAKVSLFDDYFTSTMDTKGMARAVLTLLHKEASGLLNVAARNAASKKVFAEALARRLGRPFDNCRPGSVRVLRPARAESVGLDVRVAESILGYRLPDLDDVIASLVSEYQDRCGTIPSS